MSLRIVWAGPWGERSRAAAFGAAIVAELLARGHEVQVVRTEIGARQRERPHRTAAEVRLWQRVNTRELVRASDALVLCLCDDYRACGAALGDFFDLGALGIFLDGSLRGLATGWLRTLPNRKAAAGALGDAESWFASGLAGALLNNAADLASIRDVCPGPVTLRPSNPGPAAYVDALLPLLEEVIARRPAILAGFAIGKILATLGYARATAETEACASRLNELLGPL
jgi:hypothetical protein